MWLDELALCLAEYPADEAARGLASLISATITTLLLVRVRRLIVTPIGWLITTNVADFLCVVLFWDYVKRHHVERFLHLEFEVLRALKAGGIRPVKVGPIKVEGLDQVVIRVRWGLHRLMGHEVQRRVPVTGERLVFHARGVRWVASRLLGERGFIGAWLLRPQFLQLQWGIHLAQASARGDLGE